MEFVNLLHPYVREGGRAEVVAEAVDTLLLLMAPMTPHLTAEAWERRHGDHIHLHPWPVADPELAAEESVTMVVQVNGKVRDRIDVAPTSPRRRRCGWPWPPRRSSRRSPAAQPRRVIARPPRLVNIVMLTGVPGGVRRLPSTLNPASTSAQRSGSMGYGA